MEKSPFTGPLMYIIHMYREGPPARGPVAARGSPAGEQDVPGAQGILTHSPPYIYSWYTNKKENQIFLIQYIRKFRVEQLQNHV
jgi:hypothetical protein